MNILVEFILVIFVLTAKAVRLAPSLPRDAIDKIAHNERTTENSSSKYVRR